MKVIREKAHAAATAARLLLAAGDADGATNRAYYSMFDMARVALASIDPKLAISKQHRTILNRFAEHWVRDRGFAVELGKAISRAQQARLIADYSGALVPIEDAAKIVAQMDLFLEAVELAMKKQSP